MKTTYVYKSSRGSREVEGTVERKAVEAVQEDSVAEMFIYLRGKSDEIAKLSAKSPESEGEVNIEDTIDTVYKKQVEAKKKEKDGKKKGSKLPWVLLVLLLIGVITGVVVVKKGMDDAEAKRQQEEIDRQRAEELQSGWESLLGNVERLYTDFGKSDVESSVSVESVETLKEVTSGYLDYGYDVDSLVSELDDIQAYVEARESVAVVNDLSVGLTSGKMVSAVSSLESAIADIGIETLKGNLQGSLDLVKSLQDKYEQLKFFIRTDENFTEEAYSDDVMGIDHDVNVRELQAMIQARVKASAVDSAQKALDEASAPVYQTNKDGSVKTDKNGNPIEKKLSKSEKADKDKRIAEAQASLDTAVQEKALADGVLADIQAEIEAEAEVDVKEVVNDGEGESETGVSEATEGESEVWTGEVLDEESPAEEGTELGDL